MKSIKLESLKIKNMYGYATAEVNFNDGKNVIRNKMRYGKTTLLNCVLFALGIAKGKYQPCIEEYTIKNLDSSVNMVLSVDGLSYNLCVESKQKWSVKDKETEEKVLVGNNLTYNFDGIECQYKVYKDKLADLFGVPYDRIEMLVDIRYFNTDTAKWKWNDRRELVYSLLDIDNKTKEVAQREEFAIISNELKKGKTEAEIQKSLNADKKKITDEQFRLNVILNEKTTEYATLSEINYDELKRQKETLSAEIERLKSQGTGAYAKQKELSEKVFALKKQIQETEIRNRTQQFEFEKAKAKVQRDIDDIASGYRTVNAKLAEQQALLQSATISLKMAQNSVFPESSTVCPTCGRKLNDGEISKAQDKFNAEKEKTIQELTKTIQELTPIVDALTKQKDDITQKGKEKRAEQTALVEKGFVAEDLNALNAELSKTESELNRLETESKNNGDTQLGITIEKYAEIVNKLENEKKAIKLKSDIEELKKSLIELAKVDTVRVQKQNALKLYIIAKAETASEIINNSFNGIKFRLFKINGGLAENPIEPTFEVIHEISGYASQSHGQKIYSDICIGIALRKLYGVNLFMFVDEIQSVTEPYDYPFQTIELYTTAEDVTDIKATKIKDLYTIEDTVK